MQKKLNYANVIYNKQLKFPFTALSRSFIVASWCNNTKRNCNKRAIWWINKDRKARNTNSNWNMIQEMLREWENWKMWLFKVYITMQIFSSSLVVHTQSYTYQLDDNLTLLICFICCRFYISFNVNITL